MKRFIIPTMIAIFAFFLGTIVGAGSPQPDDFRQVFEERTGINPDSFLAAGSDCENFHKEPCRLYGGWAPKSRFADDE